MRLTDEQKSEIKQILENLVEDLKSSIAEVKVSSKPVELDQTAFGRVSRIDAIQQQQLQLASLNRMQQRLRVAEQALDQAGSEEFGICRKCEESIPMERLKARPESQICMSCIRSSEK